MNNREILDGLESHPGGLPVPARPPDRQRDKFCPIRIMSQLR
jgi:hypothetical protein